MKFKFYALVFSLFASTAQSGMLDWIRDCPSNGVPSLKIEDGKVTQCGSIGSAYFERSETKESTSTTTHMVFAYGSAATTLGEKRGQNFENNIVNTVNELKGRVFPITDRNGQILGTAFQYGNVTLTALHVVVSSAPQNPLYVFDSNQKRAYLIRGYAPAKRESGAVNRITSYQDICVLDIPELNDSSSFPVSQAPITSRFQYLELSYPKNKNSLAEASAFSSFIALPKTDGDGLAILNRNGQDFNSSGGPVIDVKTLQVRALTICIEPQSNSVKAVDLNLANSTIESSLQLGFIPDLSRITYDFTYSKSCGPVGGRGGGP